jgi:hypothetical protein
MKLTVTEIAVHRETESPIFGEIVTHVKLDDEGAGLFIRITQHNDSQVNEIRLGFNEIEHILEAIGMLKEQDCVKNDV